MIALLGHGRVLAAWCIGLAVCVLVTAFSTDDLFLRVELGFLAGCGTAAAAMGLLLAGRMRSETPESLSRLVEAIEHEPLEISSRARRPRADRGDEPERSERVTRRNERREPGIPARSERRNIRVKGCEMER